MKALKTSTKPQSLIECLVLIAVALMLRVLHIGKTDLGGDESFSLYMALQSIPDIASMLCQGDNPPLWEILLHFWIKVFGISEVAIRSLPLIFSALTVIPIYLIGEKYIHRLIGFAASLCYCFSTFSIYMAHECRVYSLIGFLSASSAFLFISSIQSPKKYKLILLTLVNLMLMYGHYLSIWVIVMEFLITFIIKPVRCKIWKMYLFHAIALIAGFAPMVPVLYRRFMDSGMQGTWIEKTKGLEDLYNFFWRMSNEPITTVLFFVILIASFITLIVKTAKHKAFFGSIGILTLLWVVPLLGSFALSYITGFFLDRYFYFLFPFYYVSLSSYCFYLFAKQRVPRWSLLGLSVVAMAFSCSPDSSGKRYSGWHSDIKSVVNQLVEAKKDKNTLVILPEYFDKQFTYYLDEKHEMFRTQSQPSGYYVFHDYLLGEGYFYDCNYMEANLNDYKEVVFAIHKSMPINGLEEHMRINGFHLEMKLDIQPYEVCHYLR